MKISTKGIYALEVTVDLACYGSEEKRATIRDIAKRRGISEKYLERIVSLLKRGGIVNSARGALGGYCLARKACDITVLQVLEAAEGDLAPVECLVRKADCKRNCDTCPTRKYWKRMWEILKGAVKDTTIESIVKSVVDKESAL